MEKPNFTIKITEENRDVYAKFKALCVLKRVKYQDEIGVALQNYINLHTNKTK